MTAPTFKQRSWSQEVSIAENKDKDIDYPELINDKRIIGYEFSNGRKFDDKVEKNKSYE